MKIMTMKKRQQIVVEQLAKNLKCIQWNHFAILLDKDIPVSLQEKENLLKSLIKK